MIQFPTVDEALELHSALIARFGGATGVHDLGLLESALYRPQTGHYEDIVEMAAALFESLLINHPFIDGNKRTAFFLTDIFLRCNGWKITVQPQVGYHFILKILDEREHRFAFIAKWLRHHIQRLKAVRQ